MCAASVCVLQVCVLLVCDRTIESWETQIVARLSGYAACPCVWITCFSYMPHCCWGMGDRVRRRGVGVCVVCVLNCICLTFWHVQHRLKITFAAEKCRTIR